jgi:hypothetical protein
MMSKPYLQPPVGTVITKDNVEDIIDRYPWFLIHALNNKDVIREKNHYSLIAGDIKERLNLPWKVKGMAEGFTVDENFFDESLLKDELYVLTVGGETKLYLKVNKVKRKGKISMRCTLRFEPNGSRVYLAPSFEVPLEQGLQPLTFEKVEE